MERSSLGQIDCQFPRLPRRSTNLTPERTQVLSAHTSTRERRYDIEIWQTESCEPRVVPIRGRICNSNRPEQFVSSAYVKEFYLYCMLISGICKLITRCEISSYADQRRMIYTWRAFVKIIF